MRGNLIEYNVVLQTLHKYMEQVKDKLNKSRLIHITGLKCIKYSP